MRVNIWDYMSSNCSYNEFKARLGLRTKAPEPETRTLQIPQLKPYSLHNTHSFIHHIPNIRLSASVVFSLPGS